MANFPVTSGLGHHRSTPLAQLRATSAQQQLPVRKTLSSASLQRADIFQGHSCATSAPCQAVPQSCSWQRDFLSLRTTVQPAESTLQPLYESSSVLCAASSFRLPGNFLRNPTTRRFLTDGTNLFSPRCPACAILYTTDAGSVKRHKR